MHVTDALKGLFVILSVINSSPTPVEFGIFRSHVLTLKHVAYGDNTIPNVACRPLHVVLNKVTLGTVVKLVMLV